MDTLIKIGIGAIVIPAIMLIWVSVQLLWKRIFTDHVIDQDALAGRSDCGSCGCSTPCQIKKLEHIKPTK